MRVQLTPASQIHREKMLKITPHSFLADFRARIQRAGAQLATRHQADTPPLAAAALTLLSLRALTLAGSGAHHTRIEISIGHP